MTDEKTIGELNPLAVSLLATALFEVEQGGSFKATMQQVADAVASFGKSTGYFISPFVAGLPGSAADLYYGLGMGGGTEDPTEDRFLFGKAGRIKRFVISVAFSSVATRVWTVDIRINDVVAGTVQVAADGVNADIVVPITSGEFNVNDNINIRAKQFSGAGGSTQVNFTVELEFDN